MAKDFPDYADWCQAAARTEPQISEHLGNFVGYLNRDLDMETQDTMASSSSTAPAVLRERLVKVKAELIKTKSETPAQAVSPGPQPGAPQWDGEENSLEDYLNKCRRYATLKKRWQEEQ